MHDPLKVVFEKFDYNHDRIQRMITGKRYTAIVLENGQIGLGAVLDLPIPNKIPKADDIDFSNYSHRILLTAYYNALLNYTNTYESESDIFDKIDFAGYHKRIMIGLCHPLYNKMKSNNINVDVFDEGKDDHLLIPMDMQKEHLSNADCLIITSTSVINNTFPKIFSIIPQHCDVYLYGPSALMHSLMFEYTQLKYIFGSTFDLNDERVLEVIANDLGTPYFSKFMHKVYVKRK